MRSLETQATTPGRSVAAARKNYDLANEGYKRGLTDYLNVLIAQNQLLRAQEGVARIQAERLAAHASLMTALGGGLAEPADSPKRTRRCRRMARRRSRDRAERRLPVGQWLAPRASQLADEAAYRAGATHRTAAARLQST